MVSCTALFFFLPFFSSVVSFSSASDSISPAESIKPGQTLVSAGGIFELGFFNPGNSVNQYVGVWYKMSTTTIVWVANRGSPVVNTPGILRLTQQGILTVSDSNETLIWSSNSSRLARISPSAQLLDSGNFVVTDGNSNSPDDILWQGFDYPTDTQLPGMKIGRYVAQNRDVYQSDWRSDDDPAEGDVTFKLETDGVPEFFLSSGSAHLVRSGPWNGLGFSGRHNLKQNNVYKFGFYSDSKWTYYAFEPYESSVLLRSVISQSGDSQMLIWNEDAKSWNSFLSLKTDHCDSYALCGTFAACNINNSPLCGCLKGFVPRSQADWEAAGWSTGCIRRTPLNCSNTDGFVRHSGVKVPETRNAWSNSSMTLEECRMSCLKNCLCTAYTNSDIRNGGTGCLIWLGELIDIREYPQGGQDIFIKLAHSELDGLGVNKSKQIRSIIISVLSASVTVLGLILIVVILKKMKWRLTQQETLPTAVGQILTSKRLFGRMKGDSSERGYFSRSHHKDSMELPLFDFDTVAKATGDFSNQNMLGQGGFGPVYKGVLEGGQEIAVKRLSSESKQGMDEFANEVLCIVKLQHRNLVKLLGCCIDKEKMLVYEFMSNKSLDYFIFDEKKRMLLDWPKRFSIICGIARGLLYLHRDSRLRIIHRDLKASNILLDHDMNPKISDFGMARCFGGNETSANTARVVGTYGYMSPEYAIDGIFSMKSDVFSYGVLVLEIITGKRNRGFNHKDHHLNLLGHVWGLYDKGGFTELIDDSISDSCNLGEILRSIHVGLLCVQQNPEDRPNMETVVVMLCNGGKLPEPKKPGFFTSRHVTGISSSSSNQESCSTNEMSMTLLAPR